MGGHLGGGGRNQVCVGVGGQEEGRERTAVSLGLMMVDTT